MVGEKSMLPFGIGERTQRIGFLWSLGTACMEDLAAFVVPAQDDRSWIFDISFHVHYSAVFALLEAAQHRTVLAMLMMSKLCARGPRDVSLSSCLLDLSNLFRFRCLRI